MASLREIRRKIKSIKSTQQITKAMKMVAAARLRRAQGRILAARPFAERMERMVAHVLAHVPDRAQHPLLEPHSSTRRALLLVTSDKGLCGAFNTNLIRQTVAYLRQHGAENVSFYVVGRKGRDYFRRIGVAIAKEYIGISNQLSFAHAEIIAEDLITAYKAQELATVDMIYNEFKSVIQQRVSLKSLLPLASLETVQAQWPDYLYEPSEDALLEALLPRFIKAQVFRVLLESNAAELGARMSAMDSATRNAKELMSALTLRLNRTRQASITKEILEVVSGAEALK